MAQPVVRFCEDTSDLVRSVAAFLCPALERGDVVVVVATDAHRLAIEIELANLSMDVAEAVRLGCLLTTDTDAALAACVTSHGVERSAFRRVVGALIAEATAAGRPVIVYGDMVACLWDLGQVPAAIEIEGLWAELNTEVAFTRFCAYPSQLAGSGEGSAVLRRLYDLDTEDSTLNAPGRGGPSTDEIQVAAEFSAGWSTPGTARRWARSVLGHWKLATDELLDDVSLAVTELANNAVLHAHSTFTVGVHTDVDLVRISVRDDSLTMPAPASPGVTDRFGRGLGIVAALATSWGVDADGTGKVVWAQFEGLVVA